MNQLINSKIELSPEYVEMRGLDSDEMYLTTFESLPKEVKRKIKLSLRRQILDEMKKESEWSNLLRCKVRDWKKDPNRYSSTHEGVFNTEMSPEKFYDVFVTPEMVKTMEEEMEKELVGNSPLNRPPSKSGTLFETRMKYGFMIVCGVSDSNFFPVTVVDDSDGLNKRIGYCLLKDRGNITFVLSKYGEQLLNINEWTKLIGKIKDDSFNEYKLKNKRFKSIIERIENRLSKYTTPKARRNTQLSLKEILGKKVWDAWWYSESAMNIRAKFETLGVSTNEMQAYNNNETIWIEHNFLTAALTLEGCYNEFDIDIDEYLKIHNDCLDDNLFLGKHNDFLTKVKHQKIEGFEPWFIIDNVACLERPFTGENSFISLLSGNPHKPTKNKIKLWNSLFRKKKDNGKFMAYELVSHQIKLIKKISKLDINKYNSAIEEAQLIPEVQKISNADANRLTLRHPDNVNIFLKGVVQIAKYLYKGRTSIDREVDIASELLKGYVDAVESGWIQTKLVNAKNTGTVHRYNYFFKHIIQKVQNDLDLQKKSGKAIFDSKEFRKRLLEKLKDNFVSISKDGKCEVFDKLTQTEWMDATLDFKNTAACILQKCHLNRKLQETVDNMMMHLGEVNRYHGDEVITNLDSFMSEVNDNLRAWAKKNDKVFQKAGVPDRYGNTLVLNDCVLEVYKELNA